MTLTVMLDVLVAGLLLATIVYAALLSRRLGALRNDKAQLEALVKSLDDSARRAEASVAALNAAAEEVGRELQQRLDRGQALRTDLTYIIDLGGNLADRLEGTIRSGRGEARQGEPTGPAPVDPAHQAEPRLTRRPSAAKPLDAGLGGERREPPSIAAGETEASRVTGFPSRAERLLRRALEARR
jgi:hypothetical protein